MKILLKNVRGSFVYIAKPRKNADGTDGKYGVQVLIPKSDKKTLSQIQTATREALKKKFGSDAAELDGKKMKIRFKLPLRDGDEEREGAEYEGHYFININGTKRPGILNKRKDEADQDDIEDYCYSGAYFHISCSFYPFESQDGGKPGVAVGLNNVMLHRKGERLDGTTTANDDFKDFEVEEDEFDDFDDDLA